MKRPKLYILDDDAQYAELLQEVAVSEGWDTESIQDPAKFLERDLSAGGVLILDLIMPNMDGVEVIRALAKKRATLSLILVSGFDARVLHSAQQLAEAHNIRVLANLTKPIPLPKFIQTLNHIPIDVSTAADNLAYPANTEVTAEELDSALNTKQLVLYYQPQIDIRTDTLIGVEALLRWDHPEKGIILPEQFIRLAESSGLIDRLTEQVIVMAVKQSQEWTDEGLDIAISINVSADNITSLGLPEKFEQLMNQHMLKPSNCTLELTETAVMGKLTSSLDVLSRLRMKGFSLSIDDFGTGYSSFSHLYKAPFSELKIDKQFVTRMLDDKAASVIVKICIMLGHMLDMKLVAEGVESQQILTELKLLGCDIAQGYFFAKPMPANELAQWRNTHYGNA